jgi:fructokinase
MILCCGEALIDMLPRESVAGEPAFAPFAGGAPFNSAVALGRLGAPTEFFSGLSTDLFGERIREALRASGVGVRYAALSARPTTLAFVRLDGGQASYTFYDENTAGRMLAEADLPALGEEITAMLFGAISLIGEPCGSAYEALMAREHGRRAVMLDPNIRPGFIADRERHVSRMRRMIAMADIVKLSEDDLAWFGETGAQDAVAARWLDAGPKLVIVTAGARGATGYTRDHRVAIAAHPAIVVDTVGAGDTFNAGVLASLHAQGLLTKGALGRLTPETLRAALTLGARAAAVTVSRAGANPPRADEIA